MADPAYFTLRKMLLDEITPVVMVLPTPLVEQRCQKNGLSFVQMLTPFSVFNNIDVPVRTASDQPYRLQKFKLRMFYASDIRPPNIEVTKKRLEQVIADAGKTEDSELYLDPSPIETMSTSSEPEFVPTWFQYFNKELVRSVSFSEHEAFDHPVACLLVVSSNDEDPINKFVDLFNTNQLPPLFNDGAMDPKIPKYYILVHDNQDGSPERATKILAEMRNTFGSNDCRLLCINSSQGQLVDHKPNPWDPYRLFKWKNIIGYVFDWSTLETTTTDDGKPSKRISVTLKDLDEEIMPLTLWDEEIMPLTLWDDYADQVATYMQENPEDAHVVFIVQFGHLKQWRGYCLSKTFHNQ